MRTLADLVLIAFVLIACGKDEDEGFPTRRTPQYGLLIDARPKRIPAPEVDLGADTRYAEILIEQGASDFPRFKQLPIEIVDAIAYQVGLVMATGDTDGKTYVRVALWSYTGVEPASYPFTQWINGKLWYAIYPTFPALKHEWGHVLYGGNYGHKVGNLHVTLFDGSQNQ